MVVCICCKFTLNQFYYNLFISLFSHLSSSSLLVFVYLNLMIFFSFLFLYFKQFSVVTYNPCLTVWCWIWIVVSLKKWAKSDNVVFTTHFLSFLLDTMYSTISLKKIKINSIIPIWKNLISEQQKQTNKYHRWSNDFAIPFIPKIASKSSVIIHMELWRPSGKGGMMESGSLQH